MVDEDRLARLTPAQRRLYEQRLRSKRDAHGIAQPVKAASPVLDVRCSGPGPHALSFPQERFWFLDQLEPGSTEYNVSGAARVRGRLDRAALEGALTALVARQASLRTTLPARDGVPGQVVGAPAAVALPLEDLRGVAVADREHVLARRLREFARQPFDLARGPLFRMLLLVLADDDHVVAMGLNHAVCDGWSVATLVRELSVLYRAHARGHEAELPALPIQYADYAAWQRERLAGPELERLLAHWRTALAGAPSSLELPFDHARRALPLHTGSTLRWALDPALLGAVRSLAAAERATPFVLLLASFQAFLARVCDEEDVVVGTSVANRDRREIESVIGAFVNTLVLRTACGGDPTFRELVARAQATTRAALAHAELPFERLVAELAPARDPSRTPLFNVFFDMVVPRPKPAWDDLDYEELTVDHGNALFDLSLSIEETAAGLQAAFEFSTELFEPATVERLRRLYTHFLGAAVAAPGTRLSQLPLLDAEERQRVLVDFNATALPYEPSELVHVLFARRAALAPAAIALEDGPIRVSYAELDARANRLARALVRFGAVCEARVAVCLPRSIDAIVALLAVWKAGAAYVPLDVDDPSPRWIERLADVGALALVTHRSVAQRVAGAVGWDGAIVALDEQPELLCAELPTDPGVALRPDALAYVLFTSGSTGKPKGVMIEHGALANHLAWVRTAFDLRPDDRFLLRTPFTFDASLWEIVHPLAQGATLVVAPRDVGHDPARLLELCARARISILQTVPSLLRVWLEEPCFADCRALRHLICAGEALDPDLFARFAATTREHGLRIALHNLYGPSEACIDATWHTLAPDDAARGLDAIPIGKPISNSRAYVLDACGEPVPVGVVGELWLGGDGLGRGYWNDPDLSAQRFVPNAFGPGRLYRTGDRARWNADGTLSYVGRADRQLKISGVRIEPGEIEGELRAHADVRDAAVVAVRDPAQGFVLRAFVTPAEGCTLDPSGLRAFLGTRLPRALVPASITVLEALPLNASLKTDLRALQDLAVRTGGPTAYEPPRTATEARLAELAGALLSRERVGRTDDFFALGGHSLLAARLVARIRDEWRIDLPLARFFEEPTVAGLARVIAGGIATHGPGSPTRIQRAAGELRELSFAQEGLWMVQQLDPQSTLYDVCGGLRLRGTLDAEVMARALDRVAVRHEILRSTFEDEGGTPRARIHERPIELERLDLSADPRGGEAALRAFLAAWARHVFDLRRGPLIRVALLRLAAEEHVLALCVHHIVADGWSLELFAAELARCYAAGLAGVEPDLPSLPIQYADWAAWERAQACGERFAAHLAHWRAALAGAPLRTRLPFDHGEADAVSNAGAIFEFTVDPTLAAAARAFARDRRSPLYPVLAAAFAAVLRRAGADDDLVLGTVTGIRPHAVLETLIGPFVNVLPLRVDLGGDPGFDELVRRVAQSSAAAFEHASVPFERIAQEAGSARTPGREPFVNVACDLQSFPESRARFPGLVTELVRVDPGTAKLDLSLTFEDDGRTLNGSLQYATALFERSTIEALARRFTELLAAAVASPDRSLLELVVGSAHSVAVALASSELERLMDRAFPRRNRRESMRSGKALVIGPSGAPQPAGFAGELCLGADGLEFSESPDDCTGLAAITDSSRPDVRLWRTGLSARITAAGRIVELGRIDEALLVGGRRVLPSVIERELAVHPDVRASFVERRAVEDSGGQLVAHVVPRPGASVDLAALDSLARSRLAAAWIPSLWRIVTDPPAATDGSIDREQLARTPLAEFASAPPAQPVAPRDELESALHDLFAAALGRDRLSVHADFFALGGSSLAAMRLVARVRAATGVDVALADFYASATVAGVARSIVAMRAGKPRVARPVDLRADAHLGPEFPARVAAAWSGPPQRWLLTGATGYLGAFLLRALLDRGAEQVHCLVRGQGEAQALDRIRANLRRYELATDGLAQRVGIVRGDLQLPGLGLDAAQRERLAGGIDGVLHSGAAVNFLADYPRLVAANVRATSSLLELAARRGLPFHHVSTLGVFAPTADRARVQREDDPLPGPEGLEWGYEQSKWVAEALVAQARERGLGVTIHRPGRIAGSARSAVWNLDDFAARLMRGIVAIGAAPDLDVPIDMTPVDWVADAIAHLAQQRPRGVVYHLANPQPTSFLALFERLRARGAQLRIVPLRTWLAEARAAVAGRVDHDLAPLLEMLGAGREDVEPARLVPDIDLPQLDLSNTLRDVVGAGIACPRIDDALRDRWIDCFVRAGAIDLGGGTLVTLTGREARSASDAPSCSAG